MVQVHAFSKLSFNPGGGFFRHAGRLWFSAQEALGAPPPNQHLAAERVGLASVPLDGGVEPAVLPIPCLLGERPTGSSGVRREVRLLARAGERFFASIVSPFQDDRGWGRESFLLDVDITTGTWRVLTAEALPLRTLSARDVPDAPSLAVGSGDLLCRVKPGQLDLALDGTAYHLEDWVPAVTPLGSIQLHGVVGPEDAPRSSRFPSRLLEDLVCARAAEAGARGGGGALSASILHAHDAGEGTVRVVARLFGGEGTWTGVAAAVKG